MRKQYKENLEIFERELLKQNRKIEVNFTLK